MNVTAISNQEVEDEYYYDDFYESPVTRDAFRVFNLLVLIISTGSLAVFGVISNIVNFIVFYRQGPMSNSSTVILTGLSISDLWVSIMGLALAILSVIDAYIDYSKWSWNVGHFLVIIVNRPSIFLTQVTCVLTTFMTFERVISVTFPFKVKAIFTPSRSLAVVVLIFVITFFLHIPNLFEYKIAWYTEPNNVSYRIAVPSDMFPQTIYTIYFYTSPVVLRFTSLFLVIMFNVIIFWKVKLSQKFRKSNANTSPLSGSKTQSVSKESTSSTWSSPQTNTQDVSKESTSQEATHNTTKEMKLLRMIVVVSIVFSACYSFSIIHTIVFFLVLKLEEYHWTVEYLSFTTASLFQLFNSSINIVIYYNMSSRFREELHLCWSKVNKKMP